MIRLTVTGDSFPIRKVLDHFRFQHHHLGRNWYRVVKESELNKVLGLLTPEHHYGHNPEINVKLESTDKNREGVVHITLTPEGAKAGVDYLEIFKRKMSEFQIVTNNKTPASPDSGKKKEWKKLPKIDEDFF